MHHINEQKLFDSMVHIKLKSVMPKVSILIPVYNAEKFLDKCIKSAVKQSLKDIEIIIVNDDSMDSSANIINKYSDDERIKVINKTNSGYGASLNIAINESSGDYIAILKPDDFLEPNMLKKLYAQKGYDIIKSGFYYHPQNTEYKLNLEGEYSIDDKPEMINIIPSIWSALYKRDFLINNDIKFNESKGASNQDIAFQFKTFYSAKSIFFTDEPLYNHRTDTDSSNAKAKGKINAVIDEFKIIEKFLENKVILPETNAQLILFELRAYICNFKHISKFYENEFMTKASQKLKSQSINHVYKSKYINLKEKIKLYLFVNYPYALKYFLSIIKNYTK